MNCRYLSNQLTSTKIKQQYSPSHNSRDFQESRNLKNNSSLANQICKLVSFCILLSLLQHVLKQTSSTGHEKLLPQRLQFHTHIHTASPLHGIAVQLPSMYLNLFFWPLKPSLLLAQQAEVLPTFVIPQRMTGLSWVPHIPASSAERLKVGER